MYCVLAHVMSTWLVQYQLVALGRNQGFSYLSPQKPGQTVLTAQLSLRVTSLPQTALQERPFLFSKRSISACLFARDPRFPLRNCPGFPHCQNSDFWKLGGYSDIHAGACFSSGTEISMLSSGTELMWVFSN